MLKLYQRKVRKQKRVLASLGQRIRGKKPMVFSQRRTGEDHQRGNNKKR